MEPMGRSSPWLDRAEAGAPSAPPAADPGRRFDRPVGAYPAGVLNEELGRRLEEAGVRTSEDQLEELATAYPALREWIAVAERLAGAAQRIPDPS